MKKKTKRRTWQDRPFAGWGEYRYAEAKPVTLAGQRKQKSIFPHDKRSNLVDRVGAIMGDWRASPFEHEATCLHGLRSALCDEGHGWRQSNYEAEAIVEDAIRVLGHKRPDPEEGQPDWCNGTDYCSSCNRWMDEEDRTKGRRFCSTHCARVAMTRRQRQEGNYIGRVLRSAARLITKEAAPPRICGFCEKTFRTDAADGRYCSIRCARRATLGDRLLADIQCEACGRTAKPHRQGAKFCSVACSAAVKVANERKRLQGVLRECACCTTPFTPTSERQKHCSQRCGKTMARRAEQERKADGIAGPFNLTCSCCGRGFVSPQASSRFCKPACRTFAARWEAGTVRTLTPKAFDYILRLDGARVTEDRREAA